jgi:putative SOS response-associated peptidase YedK
MMPIHDRMPVILSPNDYNAWLDPGNADENGLRALLRPVAADSMVAYKVCRAVNSSRGESPTFVESV